MESDSDVTKDELEAVEAFATPAPAKGKDPRRIAASVAIGAGSLALGWPLYKLLYAQGESDAYMILSIVGMMLMPAFWFVDRRGLVRESRVLLCVLAAFASSAVLINGHSQFFEKRKDHGLFVWNLYHYMLGTKYFPEVGYFDLYRASIVADDELEKVFQKPGYQIRDMHTYEFIPIEDALVTAKTEGVRDKFAPDRWENFKKDLRFFQKLKGGRFWKGPIADRGFNPSPAWLILHEPILNLAKWRRMPVLDFLCDLNSYLLLGAILALWWAFGLRVSLISTLWFCLWFGNDSRVFGGYFAYDWFVYFIFFICLAERGWKAAGAPWLAYSAMMRGFTGLVALHGAVRWVIETARRRRLPAERTRFFLALVASCMVIVALGSMTGRGFDGWLEWKEKISIHSENHTISYNRIGLKFLFSHDYTTGKWVTNIPAIERKFEKNESKYKAASFALMALTLLAMIRRKDHDGYLLFIPFVYFAMMLSRYYFSVAVLLFTWREFDRRGIGSLLSSMWLFFVPAFFHWHQQIDKSHYRNWWWANVQVVAYFLIVIAYFLVKDARELLAERRARKAPPPSPTPNNPIAESA
ncbi:MAG: hypothetical protein IT350_03490 [Deltaproteobacteria bacterium]|nr:hypothetical protein [Deltaproteobacteria bacterium]